MSGFMELGDESDDLHVVKSEQTNLPVDKDDQLSLNSQDIELGTKSKFDRANLKEYITRKKAEVKDQLHDKKVNLLSIDEFRSDKRKILVKAAAGEFLVTSLFIFIVCAVQLNLTRLGHSESESMVVGALCAAFSSVALIYSFADVSGAHFNPAVTFATIVTRKTSVAKGAIYILFQLMASVFAMLLLVLAFPRGSSGISIPEELVIVPSTQSTLFHVFIMEFMLTFMLVYVIFAVAFDTVKNNAEPTKVLLDNGPETSSKGAAGAGSSKNLKNLTIYTASGSSKAGFAPLSIGLTIGFLCLLGGSVSGGAFNPARVFGAGLCAGNYADQWAYMWIYWVADFCGAAAAGLIQQNIFATN